MDNSYILVGSKDLGWVDPSRNQLPTRNIRKRSITEISKKDQIDYEGLQQVPFSLEFIFTGGLFYGKQHEK